MSPRDPFGTESLRAATLQAWLASPTRLREDAATEADLVRGGYRDRVWTELAQNAADAAQRADRPGALTVWLDRDLASDDQGGRERIHVANTGAPLDRSGVEALCALRASGKTGGVGRFGVGFTAVLAVADLVEVRSSTGSVRFSAEETARALAEAGLTLPREGTPTLRLAWPAPEPPAEGDTEVVLWLRPDVGGRELLDALRRQTADLLLELPALQRISVGDAMVERISAAGPEGLVEHRIGGRRWFEHAGPGARWLVPIEHDRVRPVGHDVLRAPTASDEELSLPAVLIADVPMQPDRRRVLPGAPLGGLARSYPDLLAALPRSDRVVLVPQAGFARGEVDGLLREAVFAALRTTPWLPAADGPDLAGDAAVLVPGLTDELAELLADVLPGLAAPEVSATAHATVLAQVGVRVFGPARLTEELAAVERSPQWWGRLYDALEPLVVDAVAAEELAALPVPLSDGRTVTGPRTALLGVDLPAQTPPLPWLRLVHPAAAHPLLARLGAATATAADLVEDPAIRAATDDLEHDFAGDDPVEDAAGRLADAVLALVAAAGSGYRAPEWLGALLLPDTTGELRAADELLLPGAPLAEVLADDAPFAVAAQAAVDRYGRDALRAVGVGWGFTVLRAELPTGPDHDLADEEQWWEGLTHEPETVVAVRDLDLVDDARWARALDLLAADPQIREALADRDGYTCWWLRRHALLQGVPLGLHRSDGGAFAGLLDLLDHPAASALTAVVAGDRVDSPALAQLLVDRLADPDRTPAPAVVADTHRRLAAAVDAGALDPLEVTPPERVRALDAAVAEPETALVLDLPWFGEVVPADRLVLGDLATASALAELLDLPLASNALVVEVISHGRTSTWDREPGAVLAAVQLGRELPSGTVVVHDRLVVRVRRDEAGAPATEHEIGWWVEPDGVTHCTPGWVRPRSGR
ncbi:sacsin N-terminal ATP-binding-like domain-containing protein [Speluncibacter jeojiensis]|uniref:ATP-binding protein n=1 Tax=Speluncibacter jeojiensis TaxID=2710754 RepID=A0A9X4RHB7_9ACTN|nr:ATP-binding protein [Corynebacteriales bacterium D3-21]